MESCSHQADGYRSHQFLETLSRLYLEPDLFIPCVLLNTETLPAPARASGEVDSRSAILASSEWTPQKTFSIYTKDYQTMAEVRMRFTPERLEKLRQLVNVDQGEEQIRENSQISRLDAVSSYIACLVTHCDNSEAPIEFVRNNYNVSLSLSNFQASYDSLASYHMLTD